MKPELINQLEIAAVHEKNGSITAAINEYLAIIQSDDTFREAYINLGVLYSKLQRFDDAIQCYDRALKLKKDYITLFNIGSLYYKKKEYKKAILFLEKSKHEKQDFLLPLQVMGLCYSRLNNLQAAEQNFQKVISIWPKNRVALTALSIMFFNQGRYEEALKLLHTLDEIDPHNKNLKKIKYSIFEKTGHYDNSLQEIKEITKISQGYKIFNDFIKSVPVEIFTDKYGTMDEKITMLSNEEPHSDTLISLSLCHLFNGDTDRAIDYLYEARKTRNN
jgi:tetratricopeptide (TPR) repeat protein